jgi:hypothetical protein
MSAHVLLAVLLLGAATFGCASQQHSPTVPPASSPDNSSTNHVGDTAPHPSY